MLNRRTLRVKDMQARVAYKQCKEANYNVEREKIIKEEEKRRKRRERKEKGGREEEVEIVPGMGQTFHRPKVRPMFEHILSVFSAGIGAAAEASNGTPP